MIKRELVFFKNDLKSQDECLRYMADAVNKLGLLSDEETYLQAVYKREEEFSTAVGFDVAIPHGMSDAVNEAFIAFLKTDVPILWVKGDDAKEVKLIFMIGVPETEKNGTHLKFISQISRHLIDEKFRSDLLNCKDADEAYNYLNVINDGIKGGK